VFEIETKLLLDRRNVSSFEIKCQAKKILFTSKKEIELYETLKLPFLNIFSSYL